MRFSATTLATELGGRLLGPEVGVDGVATDTRDLRPGQLFVPLRVRRDGHEFIDAAVAAGAPAYLTDGTTSGLGTAIVVADTAQALTAIGRMARRQLHGQVVGVTGSVGKTTVKDLTRGVFSSVYRTQASPMSFNNEIGLPLTLANAPDDVEVVVAELGARGPGHIAELCRVALPTIGIVTRIGLAHTEFFGSLEVVAAAKAELVEALPAGGLAVLNGDDPFTPSIAARSSAPVLLFGTGPRCDVVGRRVRLNDRAQATFELSSGWGEAEVSLALHGEHQVPNALAAASAALWAGVPLEKVAESLARVENAPWRMNLKSLGPGVVLVNDAYNANPTSTEAALRALSAITADRRVAVLGAMAELGHDSEELHHSIGGVAASLGITLIGYQTLEYGERAAWSPTELIEQLRPFRRGDAILVKGSRVTGMESMADTLERTINDAASS
jgi:UDP-N-acetylmuramoyl-tripeptide--D-alanyl-D-alanine ligase